MYKKLLLLISFLLLITSLSLIFFFVPTERTMGIVQRIFYFHVPVAWVSLLAFVVVFIGSIGYLWKRSTKWDIVASSSAEIGVVFTSLMLITGSIWAKPIWGVWWTWEPRLTTALILWINYVAYLLVRTYTTEEQRGARFSAVIGIVGFADVPLVAMAITLWRTQHPSPVIFEGGLTPPMLGTLLVSVAAFTSLYFVLLIQRVSIKSCLLEINKLKVFFT